MTRAQTAAINKLQRYAKGLIKTAMRKDGIKLSSFTNEQLQELVKELLKEASKG